MRQLLHICFPLYFLGIFCSFRFPSLTWEMRIWLHPSRLDISHIESPFFRSSSTRSFLMSYLGPRLSKYRSSVQECSSSAISRSAPLSPLRLKSIGLQFFSLLFLLVDRRASDSLSDLHVIQRIDQLQELGMNLCNWKLPRDQLAKRHPSLFDVLPRLGFSEPRLGHVLEEVKPVPPVGVCPLKAHQFSLVFNRHGRIHLPRRLSAASSKVFVQGGRRLSEVQAPGFRLLPGG